MAATTFFAQASANRRNSFLLALFVVAVLGLLGFFVGYAIVGDPSGRRGGDRVLRSCSVA